MTYDPTRIAATILADSAHREALSLLDAPEFRLQLWHLVAGIVINEYMGESNGTPPPDIDLLTDSVLPIVADALKKT